MTDLQTAATPDLPRPLNEASVPRLTSQTLLKGARELLIEHDGAFYRLRLTGKGKLILTK